MCLALWLFCLADAISTLGSSAGQAAQKAPVAPAASGAPSVFVATVVHAYR